MSSRIMTRGIGLTLLLVLSAQAINYDVYQRYEKIKLQPKNDTILSSRDLLEQLNYVEPKASYSLQEATEHLLYYGALLRARILDIFGNLLYIHYDDFSVREVKALRSVYWETFERRYNIFHLVTNVLRNPNTKPSKICTDIYALTGPCLKSSANVCRGIRKRHDVPYPDDLVMYASKMTYLVYHSSKISTQYHRGFSLPALLKLLQQGVLSITPNLLSGLLYHVRYDVYDGDVILAEQELIRFFSNIAGTTRRSSRYILEPMSPKQFRKYHSVASFLRYYIAAHFERFVANDKLKRHALLIVKHLVDDVGPIDENIYLLGNVYENGTIHIEYLFDLVLPDDVLHGDVIEAKKYLVDKLIEFDVLEKYLRVSKYQQATPAHLVMEITRQLQDIGFVEDIATALRIHARFWHRSYRVETLHELLRLFDAYENLRQVLRYQDVMKNLDKVRQSLSGMEDVPVEILCSAPRACLQKGLRVLLDCKHVSPEIKKLIGDFLEHLSPKGALLDEECLYPNAIKKSRRTADIQDLNESYISSTVKTVESLEAQTEMPNVDDIPELKTDLETEINTPTTTQLNTPEEDERSDVATMSPESKESVGFSEVTNETPESISKEIGLLLEESVESTSTKAKVSAMYETTEPILTVTTKTTTDTILETQEETTTTATSTIAATTTATSTIAASTTATSTIAATTTATMTTTTSATTLEDEEIPTIDMEMKMKQSTSEVHNDDSDMDTTSVSPITSVAVTSKKSCGSGECSGERSSEESNEHKETSTTTVATATMITQDYSLLETTRGTRTTSPEPSLSVREVSRETIAPTETLIAKGECNGSKSESTGLSSCRTRDCSNKSCSDSFSDSCDSLTEDCGEENSSFEDTNTKKQENSNVGCHSKVACERESSTVVQAECDTSQNENSVERCVKVCASRKQERSCEDQDDDCSSVELLPVESKFKSNQGVCEIQDPHHRQQMRRLAKMWAISAATSRHDNVFESPRRWPRHRGRVVTKKLYEVLESRPPRNENDETKVKTTGYSLLDALMKFGENEGSKRHAFDLKQRKQLYTLKEKLAKRHAGGKSRQVYRSDRTSARRGRTERIFRRSGRPSVVAPPRDDVMKYLDLSM